MHCIYTPAANFNGADSFTYTVTDGALISNVAMARITVAAVNDAPTLGKKIQSLSLAEDSAITVNLLASAADIDSTLLSAAIIASPTHGALRINADGMFDDTPEDAEVAGNGTIISCNTNFVYNFSHEKRHHHR